jgi:hypothetical protein
MDCDHCDRKAEWVERAGVPVAVRFHRQNKSSETEPKSNSLGSTGLEITLGEADRRIDQCFTMGDRYV